jgi:hypothetical protein
MKNIFYILLLLPTIIFAQYPNNSGHKITLGEQTTADGLIYRGVASIDTLTATNKITRANKQDTSAFILLDTVTNLLWHYKTASNGWSQAGGSTFDTTSIKYVNTYGTQTVNGAKTFTSPLIAATNVKIHRGLADNSESVAIGNLTLNSTTTGIKNTAIGEKALQSMKTGQRNFAMGAFANYLDTAGSLNVAIGYASLGSNLSGSSNSGIGYLALYENTNGEFNTAIGYQAAGQLTNSNTTGSNNIFIGNSAVGESATESNRTWIGNTSTTSTWVGGNLLVGTRTNSGSRLVVKGVDGTSSNSALNVTNSSNTSLLFVRNDGNVGIGTPSPLAKLQVSGGRSYFFSGDNYSVALGQTAAQSNYMYIGTASDGTFYISETGGTARVTVQQGGNVGIGTASPGNLLTIKDKSQIGFRDEASNTTRNALQNYAYTSGYGDGLRIGEQYNAVSIGGNVGIGTTTPTFKLDVNGTGRFSGALSGTSATFSADVTSSGASQNLFLADGTTYSGLRLNRAGVAKWAIFNNNAGTDFLDFYWYGSSPGTKFKIEPTGAATFSSSVSASGDILANGSSIFTKAASGGYQISLNAQASTQKIRFDDLTGGAYGVLAFEAGNGSGGFVERMRISNGGNVLIGTINNTTNGGLLQVGQVPNNSSSSIGFNNGDNAAISARYSMTFQVNNDNNISGRVFDWRNGGKGYSDGTFLMTLNASGNLGLGVTPSAWDVSARVLQIGNFVALANYTDYMDLSTNTFYDGQYKYLNSSRAASTYTQTGGQHRFYTAPSGTAGNAITFTQAMTISSTGIGIKSTPNTLWDASTNPMDFSQGSGIVSNVGQPVINVFANYVGISSGAQRVVNGRSSRFIVNAYNDLDFDFVFYSAVNGNAGTSITWIEKLKLLKTGEFGIGDNIVPTQKLDVDGNARIRGLAAAGVPRAVFADANGTLTATSSILIKENVENINYGLLDVLKLKPVSFNYIDKEKWGEGKDLGFVAEDVMNIIPESTGVMNTSDIYHDMTKLIPVLTKAIQEQNVLIKALEQRIINLENK